MRFILGLALVAAVLGAACKKTDGTPAAAESGSAVAATPPAPSPVAPPATPAAAAPAATAPAAAAPAAAPWQVPAGARAGDASADATALGAAVTAHLVERVQKTQVKGARHVKLLLVLEGAGGAIIADVTEEGLAQDGAAAIKAMAGTPDVILPPLSPPRPFADKDAPLALEFKGPLVFLAHFASRGEKRDLAVAQDHDTIAVWTMIAASDSVDVAPAWEQTGTIKLAPGAKVTAPALAGGASPASPTGAAGGAGGAAAAPAAGGPLRATALDDALGAKGIAGAGVAARGATPRSQWAAVKGKLDPVTASVTAYTIWRVTSAGTSTLELAPPASRAGSWFDALSAIDAKDIDGDGIDDAVITAKWSRQLSGKSRHGKLVTTEQVDAIYVIGGAELAIGAQHAAQYTTETNLGDGENPQPAESIAFSHAIVPGSPPVLHVAVGASTISPSRVKGLLDPRSDAWLTAADLPIAFRSAAR
ncbi:MAG TPA: hypothetical protein VK607_08175 [Kofleriaceae bacterium]|nr:hypothetical protein [Kofleriaceae bacterium]